MSLTQIEAAHAARRNLKGIAAMVAATALFTCGDAAMKLVSTSLPTGQTVFLRGVSTVTIVTIAAFWTGAIYRLRNALVRAMGWRSAGDVGSALFFQAALARMPFADLMGILQMTPLSLTAASALFLGEHVGWRRWTAVATGFAGALLVIKPGSSAFNAWALLGVLSVLCGTLRDVSTRRLDVALSPLLIMMLSHVVGSFCHLRQTPKGDFPYIPHVVSDTALRHVSDTGKVRSGYAGGINAEADRGIRRQDRSAHRKRDVLVFDSEMRGFGIRKYADGRASYFVKYTLAGQQRRHTLAAVRKGNLAKMRELTEEVKARARLGQDVIGDKKAKAAEQEAAETAATVGALVAVFLRERKR